VIFADEHIKRWEIKFFFLWRIEQKWFADQKIENKNKINYK
jgi:hypothetical protein